MNCGSYAAAAAPASGCAWDVPHDLDSTRAYVSGSLWSGFGKGEGTFSDGPYGVQDPPAFFNPAFYPWAFNPEVPFPRVFQGPRVLACIGIHRNS